MTLAWEISRELARENGGSAKSWLSAGLVLAWKQWRAEEALIEVRVVENTPEWETPAFTIVLEWVKPWYRIHKDKAWRTVKFDEYQLEVLFRGKSIMVDYEVAKTEGLLSAIEKAGKEATGEMKELIRELWKVVKPYKMETLARQQIEKEFTETTPLADARSSRELWSYKDTVKGIMYAVQFRGQTVYIVKAIVLKHGWKKAIEHAAGQSNSKQYKELLRGLWRAV